MKKINKEKENSISKTAETRFLPHIHTGIFKKLKKQTAITLIALVLTIIVLLILAGVTLNLIFGENGIIGRSEKTVDITEISRVEDQANISYSDLLIGGYDLQGIYTDPMLNDVLDKLKDENYIENYGYSISSTVTGLSIDKDSFNLAKGGKNFIHVLLERTSEDGGDYYVEIDGKNFLVHKESDKIVIDKEPAEINELTVKSSDERVATVSLNGLTISVNASSSKTGNSTITVSYGDKSATCAVTVVDGSFSTAYGRIDVIWLDTANNIISSPNEPRLSGMTPITWEENEDYSAADTPTPATAEQIANKSWYNYNAGSGTADNRTSNWANAQNSDGSYFVWIPRYAYRITYYSSQESTTPTGYYDGNGMYKADANRTLRYALDEGIKTVEYNNEKYIVHPAFETDLDNGGWDSELSGFWASKYQMSRSGATATNAGSGYNTTFKSIPNVSSARSITLANIFEISKKYDISKESHLTKNSEWGAIAYLTYSAYGRNGHEIDINNSSSYITGNGGGSESATEVAGIANSYNTMIGTKASTTGNIYGIYDMSGGSWEFTASWYSGGYSGKIFEINDGLSTKYATSYSVKTSVTSNDKTYTLGKIGDSSKEPYTGIEKYLWFDDYSNFPHSDRPFFVRGGHYDKATRAGVFYLDNSSAIAAKQYGFRVVLCP